MDKIMKTYDQEWEDVAKTEKAHQAIATEFYQNEKYYNLSGIVTLYPFLTKVIALYGEKCQSLEVVEIGCGTGRETKYLADCFEHVTALDASKTMIEKAKERVDTDDDGLVTFIANESGMIPAIENCKDIVYSFIVFQHCKFDTVKSYFQEAYRVLKPGGRFIFQLGKGEVDYEPINYGDVGKRTEETLRRDLTEAGFNIEVIANEHFGLHVATKL
jgi:SAM-dependent methyltransferase